MSDIEEAIESIDPASLDYSGWLNIGMALHHEGLPMSTWVDWSRRDPARFHERDFEAKWRGFGNSAGSPVTAGTVIQMAKDRGWTPPRRGWFDGPDEAIGWDDVIVDPSWVEPAEIEVPSESEWDPVKQAVDYLSSVFDSDDIVGYVTSAFETDDGRMVPSGKGDCTRTAGRLMQELRDKGIEGALGTPNEKAGAWIRINPLTGEGVRNSDVAEFRFALVESDDMEIEKQKALIDELQLPCAAVVHSGGKSLHAIVHVDAADFDEYRRRVEYLYGICKKNGMTIDQQNKNPSRLSRFPGFMRNGRRQFIVSGKCGKASFSEWRDWIEEMNDGLPDIEELDVFDVPEPPSPVIEDVLFPGDKMMLSGPSKAGKSFLLMELCCAIAEGREWLGRRCVMGRVLYVNLELKRDFCRRRFRDVYRALGWEPAHAADIHVLDLRGKSAPLEQLSNSIIRRAAKDRYAVIVLDPIYKVMSGDENSAEEVGRFCNQLDRLAESMGCAVVYCHHHSKGLQGGKASMDRASGSGVFARDADALLDMIQLPLSDDLRKQRSDAAACAAVSSAMDTLSPGWRDDVPQDSLVMADDLVSRCRAILGGRADSMLNASVEARGRSERETAWRVTGTLREFPAFKPLDVWFDWPTHDVDETGVLADIDPERDIPKRRGGRKWGSGEMAEAKKAKAKARHDAINAAIKSAVEECAEDGVKPTRSEVLERIGEVEDAPVTKSQLKNWTGSKSDWCPFEVDPDHGNVIVDAFERDIVMPFENGAIE